MPTNHIARHLPEHLRKIGKFFPIISLTGPRQAGKTTLLREHFADYDYINLEDPLYRDQLTEDPRAFLERHSHGVIFDEAQNSPDLFSYLQLAVDEDRQPARFVVSGSQNFLLNKRITQSLAGRVAITRLLPLDLSELNAAGRRPASPAEAIFSGFYPDAVVKAAPPAYFYPSYIGSYLERDVEGFVAARSMVTFRLFMKVCAGFAGQTVNYGNIAKTVGISAATVKEWLSILEMSYILFQVPPYFTNFKKRLAKTPKLYFYDTGLLCYLLELASVEELQSSASYGALFENLIIADHFKSYFHRGWDTHRLYHYRDGQQMEVDLVKSRANRLTLTEIKSTTTYRSKLTKTLRQVAAASEVPTELELVYGGQETFASDGVRVLPWFASVPSV